MNAARKLCLFAGLTAAVGALGVAGGGPAGDRADAAVASKAGGNKFKVITKGYEMSRPNRGERKVALCPRKFWGPYGGGIDISPLPPRADGEAPYPHSYERLGVQRGWHISPVIMDPSPGNTRKYAVRIQVMCGPAPRDGRTKSPHKFATLRPGQKITMISKCQRGWALIGGGYQRTDFNADGGSIVTESHQVGKRKWKVSARAFGTFGGEVASIGYCIRSKKALIKEVSASVTVPTNEFRTVQTPGCGSKKRVLVFGGFATPLNAQLYWTNGHFENGRWEASAFNRGGPEAKLTAYGYCIKRNA